MASGKSTLDAINQVFGKEKDAISGVRWKRGSKKYCLLAALGVKNAFNSARWKNICLLLDRLGIPMYLKILKSFLRNRLLVYDTRRVRNTTKSLGSSFHLCHIFHIYFFLD